MNTTTLPDLQSLHPRALPKDLPHTIAVMLQQMRFWRLLQAATTMVGAPRYRISYRHPAEGRDEETRGCRSYYEEQANTVLYSVGVEFPVNGIAEERWRMAVAYEGDDSYHVWLWNRDGVLGQAEGVYCDNLIDVIVDLYDEQIRQRCGGFLPG